MFRCQSISMLLFRALLSISIPFQKRANMDRTMMTSIQNTLSIGIDLGGTSLRLGIFDSELRELDRHSYPTRVMDGPDAVVADMAESVRSLRNKFVGLGALTGIGIGSPGPLNLELGTLGLLPNFPGWDGYPLRDSLSRATGLPVHLESDANAAAIAEWKLGAGRSARVDSMAMITLGTGVGSGLILDGCIWHGMVGMGGELGHASIDRNGPPCPCGSRGCLELYASANGLLRFARAQANKPDASREFKQLAERNEGFSPQDIARMAEEGDISAKRCFEQLGKYLGFGLANLINILDLPLIIIGGGLAGAWNLFAPGMFTAIYSDSIVYRLGAPTQQETMESNRTFIRSAELGPSAGLLGAALLPFSLNPSVSGTIHNGTTRIGQSAC
jgi:glucokinase